MKRKLFYLIRIIFLLLLYNTSLYAIDINFGFKGSINASHFHGDYVYTGETFTLDPKPRLSPRFSAGGLVRYNLTQRISVQTELLYTTRGVRFREYVEFRNQSLELRSDLTLTYIELPVLFRITTTLPDRGPTFIREPGFTYNAYIGASLAYKTNATFSGRLTGEVYGEDFRERFKNRVWNQFSDTDISFIIGVGFEYGIRYRFTFDMRYALSIMNIGNDSQFPENIRNGMVSVFIGTVF
jgi:hypothetical protein